jgi:hypothetical protein
MGVFMVEDSPISNFHLNLKTICQEEKDQTSKMKTNMKL